MNFLEKDPDETIFDNPHFKTIQITLALFAFFGIILYYNSNFPKRKIYDEIEHSYFSGKITAKGKDIKNHNLPYFYINDTIEMDSWHSQIWDKVAIGDSIYKAKDSVKVYLFKKDTIYIFNYEDMYRNKSNYYTVKTKKPPM